MQRNANAAPAGNMGSGGSGGGGGVSGAGGASGASGSGGSSQVGKPNLNVEVDLSNCDEKAVGTAIDSFLKAQGSEAPAGTGQLFVEAGKEFDVDPLALVAIAGQETQWGQTGLGLNGWMGVGAYDSNPENAVENPTFAGIEQQIRVGAETFANLRAQNGSSADAPLSEQIEAVGKSWATDPNWAEGVKSIYSNTVAPFMLENCEGATTNLDKNIVAMLQEADSMNGLTEYNSADAARINEITKDWNQSWALDCQADHWCAAWATGLAAKHGTMDFTGCANVNYTPELTSWAKNTGIWNDGQSGQAPQAGNLIMFDWDGDGADHVGIVVDYDPSTGKVTTIEGNTSDQVAYREYTYGDARIMGYINNNV